MATHTLTGANKNRKSEDGKEPLPISDVKSVICKCKLHFKIIWEDFVPYDCGFFIPSPSLVRCVSSV